MPKSRRRSSLSLPMMAASSADAVVAATAGEDSWKTWAGRSHGTSEFQWMDLLRGSKRALEQVILGPTANIPRDGSTCPVCFTEPDQWHVTSSCSHAVCVDCLQAYAASQVKDPEQSGPLKCPVCPQALRRKDAIKALQGDPQLVRLWDEKIRNQLLRALPSYRPCPRCSSQNSNNGGGFVTPECLAPQYQDRRDEASKWLKWAQAGPLVCMAGVMLASDVVSRFPSQSPMTDVFFMIFPLTAFFPNLRYLQHLAALRARRALFKPISVDCPCCDEAFLLPSSLTHAEILDAESKQWMDRHARRCPSCSVLISKQGGCNHMHCPNCRASFCWACMQLRTTCQAYQCNNGAQFGNAIPGINTSVANAQSEDSLLNRIDSILGHQTTAKSPRNHNIAVLVAWIARYFSWVQVVIESVMIFIAALFASGISSGMLVGITVIVCHWYQSTSRGQPQYQQGRRRNHYGGMAPQVRWDTQQRDLQRNNHWTEEDMIREAIRRSLHDSN